MKSYLTHIFAVIKDVFFPFIIAMFIIYSLMYFIPSSKNFHPELLWPLSVIDWIFKFISLQFINSELYDYWIMKAYLFNTVKFVFGSLALSGLISIGLLVWRFSFPNRAFHFIINILKVTSGLHILILGLLLKRMGLSIENPLDLRLLFILALGNGALIELYFTFEAEIERIMRKEYVLAGIAWGFPRIRFPLREIALTFLEFLNARIPILFSSTIVLEYIFALDGLSSNIIYYIENRDFHNIILSAGLISIIIICFNVMIEQLRYWLDPRMRVADEMV